MMNLFPILSLTKESDIRKPDNAVIDIYTRKRSPAQASLTWEHLNVFAKAKKINNCFGRVTSGKTEECKQILFDVNGKAEVGKLLAIMGGSGTGKSTLLNTLTNRNTNKLTIEGKIKINSLKMSKSISKHAAYVQQDDLFFEYLTVKEHLSFYAMLRMDPSISKADKAKLVEETLNELGLAKCANAIIGAMGRGGISGGERKRLAIATEVLTNPSIMFCDEPTSGLDSYMAENIISVLKEIAFSGRTIVCTIHQPSSEVYALFDNIMLLAEGRVAYMGQSSGAIDFFNKVGYPVSAHFNPADYFVHTLAVKPGNEAECRERVKYICDEFQKQYFCEDNFVSPILDNDNVYDITRQKAPLWTEIKALFWRSGLNAIRNPGLLKVKLIYSIFIAILVGLIYGRQGSNLSQESVQNINGGLVFFLQIVSFTSLISATTVFCTEMNLFRREHTSGLYSTHVYFWAKTITEIPGFVIIPGISTTILYWMADLGKDPKLFFTYLGITILGANISASFGYMISCFSASVQNAVNIATPLRIPLIVVGGFFLNTASTPVYIGWLKWLSWFYYCNESLIINQWRNVTYIPCDPENNFCLVNGDDVIKTLNFDKENFNRDILLAIVLFFAYRFIGYFALWFRSRRKR